MVKSAWKEDIDQVEIDRTDSSWKLWRMSLEKKKKHQNYFDDVICSCQTEFRMAKKAMSRIRGSSLPPFWSSSPQMSWSREFLRCFLSTKFKE